MKHKSVSELGTTRSNMNRTGKTTAAQGIEKKYNEYKEFNDREVEAHICAAFMEMSDMDTLECKYFLLKLFMVYSSNIETINQFII